MPPPTSCRQPEPVAGRRLALPGRRRRASEVGDMAAYPRCQPGRSVPSARAHVLNVSVSGGARRGLADGQTGLESPEQAQRGNSDRARRADLGRWALMIAVIAAWASKTASMAARTSGRGSARKRACAPPGSSRCCAPTLRLRRGLPRRLRRRRAGNPDRSWRWRAAG